MRGAIILSASGHVEAMPIFDQLPPEVRAAIAGADFAYDPRFVAGRISRGVRPSKIIAEIATFDRRPQPWW